MSRAVWVDAGNDADYAKLKRYGITEPFYDVRDPRVTKPYLQDVRQRGFDPGVYGAWNWIGASTPGYSPTSGYDFAEWLSAKCAPLFKSTAPGFPKVCADIETHDVAYILAFLKRWRELRPHRVTDWTLEGYQGGLFNAQARIAIAASGVGVVPQAYTGGMEPFDAVDVVCDLWRCGFAARGVSVFYDAATLRPETVWSGYAFTQGRLAADA